MSLAILNYHGIQSRRGEYRWESGEETYVLSEAAFLEQLRRVREDSYNTLDTKEIEESVRNTSQTGKQVMLTFDDGHKSHLTYVLPALKKYGMHGIFFISAGLVGKGDLLDWDGVKELKREGMEIGSHGLNHISLSDLSDEEVRYEMAESKKMIEDKLGDVVAGFSVPKGFYQARMSCIAREVGYKYLFTSNFGLNGEGEELFALKRMALKTAMSNSDFEKMLNGKLGLKKYIEDAKSTARGILPSGFYERLAGIKKAVAK